MTFDRSVDDLPLAAYGGSGMELTAEDEARLDTAPQPESEPGTIDPASPHAGELTHASDVELKLDGEPGKPRNVPLELAGLATRGATLLRTSRLAAGAAFGGVIVVGLLLLAGGAPKPGAAGAAASPSTGPVAAATREPGNATLVLTGEIKQTLTFTGSADAGAPGEPIAVTWSDPTANTLGLVGPVDRGTRSTAETLVLQWTVVVKEKPITFTSDNGECTIGMGMQSTRVQGTFTCKQLESDDGKYVVGATGTYRT